MHFGWIFLDQSLTRHPQSLGLPPIEKFKGEKSPSNNEGKTASLPVKEILFKYVFCNVYIWLLAFAYFFIYIVRIGFNDWIMVYLIKFKDYPKIEAASCVLWFEIGGFLGSLFAGWFSDKIFGGKRNPINVLFTAGAICSLLLLHWNKTLWLAIDSSIIFFIGFFLFGPQMLIGMAAAELTHKKAAATSSGFVGCFAYLGAAVAGGPLGILIKTWGWDSFIAILLSSALVTAALLLPIWSVKTSFNSLFIPLKEDDANRITKMLEKNRS